MRLLITLILLLIPIPLPILLPIPTKAYSKVKKNMMLERSYGKEFNGLGVAPFYCWPLIPLSRGSIIQLSINAPLAWIIICQGGRANMSSENKDGKALRQTHRGWMAGAWGAREPKH